MCRPSGRHRSLYPGPIRFPAAGCECKVFFMKQQRRQSMHNDDRMCKRPHGTVPRDLYTACRNRRWLMTGSFYESFGEYRNTVSGQGQYAAVESKFAPHPDRHSSMVSTVLKRTAQIDLFSFLILSPLLTCLPHRTSADRGTVWRSAARSVPRRPRNRCTTGRYTPSAACSRARSRP